MNVKILRTEIFFRGKVLKGYRLLEKGKGRRVFSTRKFGPDRLYGKGKMISELNYIKKENMAKIFVNNNTENVYDKF